MITKENIIDTTIVPTTWNIEKWLYYVHKQGVVLNLPNETKIETKRCINCGATKHKFICDYCST